MRHRLSTEGSQTERALKSNSLIHFNKNDRVMGHTTRALSTCTNNFFLQDSENISMKVKARKTIAGFRSLSVSSFPSDFHAISKNKKQTIICRKPKQPQVAQDDDPEKNQDSLLDIEFLKTEGPKSLSFGLVISKLSGSDDRTFHGKSMPTILGQSQFVRSQSVGNWKSKLEYEAERQRKLKSKPLRERIITDLETAVTQEDEPVNLKAVRNTFIKTYVKRNTMHIRGYSLWNEAPVIKNLCNYDNQKVNTQTGNVGIAQLKAGFFQKKYVNTVDIINKHILINKARK